MKRSTSAPCLAEDDQEIQTKRIKSCDEEEGPSTREYLQLALAKVLELQRSMRDATYDETSDLGVSDNGDDVMRNVLTKVFRDLPGTSNEKVSQIIERGTHSRHNAEMESNRAKSIQLSGYDTCRRIALDFMKKSAKAEKPHRLPDLPGNSRRRTIGNFDRAAWNGTSNSNYDLRMRMLSSLDLHLAHKQRDYTVRLMRH